MEEIKKSMEKLCCEFNEANMDEKSKYVDLLDRLADVNTKINDAEALKERLYLEHDEAISSINAEQAIKESSEIRKDRELELEAERLELEAERLKKEAIAKGLISGIGTVGTVAVGILGIKNTRDVFYNLKEFDNKDILPVSTGWDLFRKNFKI